MMKKIFEMRTGCRFSVSVCQLESRKKMIADMPELLGARSKALRTNARMTDSDRSRINARIVANSRCDLSGSIIQS
jgi:hypothetical protein